MNREEIKVRVMQCMDEVYPQGFFHMELSYSLDRFLDDAAVEILRIAPLEHISQRTDFSGNKPVELGDGSGKVALPEGFLRLAAFRMKGWQQTLFEAITPAHRLYFRQSDPLTRGGVARPVAVIDAGALYYYSLPQGVVHEIERAEAVTVIAAGEEYPTSLIDPLCWLTACKVLSTAGEAAGAANASEQFRSGLAILG